MNEEQIIDKVSMIDQWKVSGDSYTQGELDAIGQLLELYYDNKKQLEQEKEKNKELETELYRIKSLDFYKIVENVETSQLISKDKIIELLKNEIIDISGFRCIAVEDIENLLEDK